MLAILHGLCQFYVKVTIAICMSSKRAVNYQLLCMYANKTSKTSIDLLDIITFYLSSTTAPSYAQNAKYCASIYLFSVISVLACLNKAIKEHLLMCQNNSITSSISEKGLQLYCISAKAKNCRWESLGTSWRLDSDSWIKYSIQIISRVLLHSTSTKWNIPGK